ncbi:uncharacterized protein K444DRAFT_329331 [Hyaloscypha bicolor E]|uniref:Uncharacterized protein n=1 Tax=Hyaloscypha bicolor E TaxID=1095630 RepID=A0A2J6TJH7_9HELO|nr:uncharacterized protein K444DRAFT_329331 [Hyaloscypha bicolor E]PMD63164.1 hypothetical protein K444DRAFT_329331 [Hyaloscypha bicolor E]
MTRRRSPSKFLTVSISLLKQTKPAAMLFRTRKNPTRAIKQFQTRSAAQNIALNVSWIKKGQKFTDGNLSLRS